MCVCLFHLKPGSWYPSNERASKFVNEWTKDLLLIRMVLSPSLIIKGYPPIHLIAIESFNLVSLASHSIQSNKRQSKPTQSHLISPYFFSSDCIAYFSLSQFILLLATSCLTRSRLWILGISIIYEMNRHLTGHACNRVGQPARLIRE